MKGEIKKGLTDYSITADRAPANISSLMASSVSVSVEVSDRNFPMGLPIFFVSAPFSFRETAAPTEKMSGRRSDSFGSELCETSIEILEILISAISGVFSTNLHRIK